jgi:hypothetical protein
MVSFWYFVDILTLKGAVERQTYRAGSLIPLKKLDGQGIIQTSSRGRLVVPPVRYWLGKLLMLCQVNLYHCICAIFCSYVFFHQTNNSELVFIWLTGWWSAAFSYCWEFCHSFSVRNCTFISVISFISFLKNFIWVSKPVGLTYFISYIMYGQNILSFHISSYYIEYLFVDICGFHKTLFCTRSIFTFIFPDYWSASWSWSHIPLNV